MGNTSFKSVGCWGMRFKGDQEDSDDESKKKASVVNLGKKRKR